MTVEMAELARIERATDAEQLLDLYFATHYDSVRQRTSEELLRNFSVFIYNDGRGVLQNVHPLASCEGRPCVIHNPTDHHMRGWRLHWRWDRAIFERICKHGVGHPDPDQFAYWTEAGREYESVHGCDGCCVSPEEGDGRRWTEWLAERYEKPNKAHAGVYALADYRLNAAARSLRVAPNLSPNALYLDDVVSVLLASAVEPFRARVKGFPGQHVLVEALDISDDPQVENEFIVNFDQVRRIS